MKDISGELVNGRIIFNLDEKPFENFEQAAKMRDLLAEQSAHYFRIELFEQENDSAGFVVIKTERTQGQSDEKESGQKDIGKGDAETDFVEEDNDTFSDPDVIHKVYHPALRTYFLRIPLAIMGFVLVFFALEIWVLLISALGLKGLPSVINPNLLVNLTKMAGSAWILWLLFGVLINFYGTKLTIDQQGISFNQGLFSRDQTHVRFTEIRTIGLRQGIIDRLLNIGILEFASSGTDTVDIRFINMPSPAKVRADIEGLIEQYR